MSIKFPWLYHEVGATHRIYHSDMSSMTDVDVFTMRMQGLDMDVKGTERVSHIMSHIETIISNSPVDLNVELAVMCKSYLEEKDIITSRDILEVCYVLNGGIMLRKENDDFHGLTANGTDSDTGKTHSEPKEFVSAYTQTDTVMCHNTSNTIDDDDLAFLKLIGDVAELDVCSGGTQSPSNSYSL